MFHGSLNFWNWGNTDITRANLEFSTTKQTKFTKYVLTPQFHIFFWLKNTPYINFWIENDWIAGSYSLHFLRPFSLWFSIICGNSSVSMTEYLKVQLILMADFGISMPWITLVCKNRDTQEIEPTKRPKEAPGHPDFPEIPPLLSCFLD